MENTQNPGSSDANTVTSSGTQPKSKLPVILGVVFIIVILVIGGGLLIYKHHQNSKKLAAQEESSLLLQASQSFTTAKIPQLANVVTKIKQQPNYQKDANYMYVVTMYYANTFNEVSAQSSLNQFNKDYTGQQLNPNLTKFVSVSTLRKNVASISKVLQQDSKNTAALVSGATPKK